MSIPLIAKRTALAISLREFIILDARKQAAALRTNFTVVVRFLGPRLAPEMAFHAGFTTQRAERTWRQKLDVLAELRFIDIKSGATGSASYALLWNPYVVIKLHHDNKNDGLREGQV